MDNLLKDKVSLKYLQTEKSFSLKENREKTRELISIKEDFLSKLNERLESLGMQNASFFIKATSQSGWDAFIKWQKEYCESIILVTVETELGIYLNVNVIYISKNK